MMIRGTAMNSPSSRSIPELFSDAVGQLAKLVGNEFDLARAELSEKAGQAGKAAGMIGAGAVILIPAIVLRAVRGFGGIDLQRLVGAWRLFNSGLRSGAAFGGANCSWHELSFRERTQAHSHA